MLSESNELNELIEKARKSLQKLTEFFDNTFNELLLEKDGQARLLIRLNNSVSEFKQIRKKLEKRSVQVKVKTNSFKTELVVTNKSGELVLSTKDLNFLKNLKIKI
ncbi:MAG: hypothetical protein AAB522_00955 [Patescibacteria group bacterium]